MTSPFPVFFYLDSPFHVDLELLYRSIQIHIFILIFWEPKMEVKDLEAQINFRHEHFPKRSTERKSPNPHFFFKRKKNLINKKWIKKEFSIINLSTFFCTKKPKETSFGVNPDPVHDLYKKNNEKYTQPGRFGVKSPFHYSIKRSILQSIAELIQKKEKKEKEMNKIWK